jgi:hypothetical protein
VRRLRFAALSDLCLRRGDFVLELGAPGYVVLFLGLQG